MSGNFSFYCDYRQRRNQDTLEMESAQMHTETHIGAAAFHHILEAEMKRLLPAPSTSSIILFLISKHVKHVSIYNIL